jgi:aryl-alcohol dehydrogenase-like predicted oxidoreductase
MKASVIGIGGLHFGNLCDQSVTSRIIHSALDTGINFIDTAPMYGNGFSEGYIARAIKGKRQDVILATKVGLVPNAAADGTFGVSVVPLNEQTIRASLEKSLQALETDYIDLYQVHAFDPTTPIEETMSTLTSLVREGKVRYIGCSNYLHGELEKTATTATVNGGTPFVSFQAHYNMIERRGETEVLPSCHNLKVGFICNRPLARGILTGKYKTNQPIPEGSRAVISYRIRRWLSEPTLRMVGALDDWARQRGHTVAELAISWLLAQSCVAVVVIGTRNLTQLEENIHSVDWSLSRRELAEIDGIISRLGLMSQVKNMPETLFEM